MPATPLNHDRIREFCINHHVQRLSLFGSALAFGIEKASDLDLLVEFDRTHVPGYLNLVRMERELSELLGKKVDLRTPEELSKYFRNDVISSARVLYE